MVNKEIIYKKIKKENKPGPAQVAPYPRLKNSKKTSKCQVFSFTVLENRNFFGKKISKKLHTKKMDRVARRGPLARAPGALKSHNAEKLKGGAFGVFQHPFCRKT